MKIINLFKICLLLSCLMGSFFAQAKPQNDLAQLISKQTGISRSVDLLVNRSLQNLSTDGFTKAQKEEYLKHLKAHYYHILNRNVAAAIKATFTDAELKKLLQNPSLIEKKPYKAKQAEAIKLINQTTNVSEISEMVSLVTAHHLCIKEKSVGECPKTPYSVYPN